jgi:predicted lipoprotein
VTGLRRGIALLVVLSLATGACTDDPGNDEAAVDIETEDVLIAAADEVIMPAYEALVAAFEDLAASVDALCAAPSAEWLAAARDAWREVSVAWRHTRPGDVGPAMDRRLAATVAFPARPDDLAAVLAGTDPVDLDGLEAQGASVKGIVALEVGLFGDGSNELATTAGARRCTFLASVTELARTASAKVLADWTDGYRDAFVAGMDGDLQSSLDQLVNEMIFRVIELDDQGLRALTEAAAAAELGTNRADGPAAFHLAELRATYEGVAALLAQGRLQALVRATSEDTGARLAEATEAADAAMGALPDSVTASFDDIAEVTAAEEAIQALKVLLATEVASELGVTIGFSDADGDS